jgi:sulfate/thiosulfate transport system permease protein
MATAVQTPEARTPHVGTARQRDRRRKLVRSGLIALIFVYVTILLVAPLGGIIWTALEPGWEVVSETFGRPDVKHAFYLTAVISVITVAVVTILGVIVAWVITRQHFRGRGLLNALVDLPFAVSPVTVGIMAVLLFGTGGWFAEFFTARGIQIIFATPSMVLVTIFICIPFVIREVAPVLEEVGTEEEDAARTLGASSTQSFVRVTLPNIRWGLLYGLALSTARSIGEIGAVLIVSGALAGRTETATLFILTALEERLEPQAYAVALTLAAISVLLLIAIEIAKRKQTQQREDVA